MSKDLYTPRELINKYPNLITIGWDERFITALLKKGLVAGKVRNGNNTSFIELNSFCDLVTYMNNRLEKSKIQL